MAVASQGSQAKLIIEPGTGTGLTFDSSSEAYEFYSEPIRKTPTRFGAEGIRGTRSRSEEQTRAGTYSVGGTIVFPVSPLWLDLWLPRMLGAAESTDEFDLAESLETTNACFGVMVHRVATDGVFRYEQCYVNKATFKGSAGQGIVTCDVDILGATEADGQTWPNPAPTISVAAAGRPYIFHESGTGNGFYLGGAAQAVMDFELEIDNMLDARFTNSQTATSITPQDRSVTLRTTMPYTATEDSLYDPSSADATAELVLTGSGDLAGLSTTLAFAKIWPVSSGPVVNGKNEIVLQQEYQCLRVGSTFGDGNSEIFVTNVSA